MDAVKPDDWLDDEPAQVEDEEAVIPEDWDVEEDGDWEAPMVPNPACAEVSGCGEWTRPEKPNPEYKGKWYAPMIDNPKYKGEWKPKQIANPKFYEDKTPLANIGKIGAVGVEVWTMSKGLVLDNIVADEDIAAVKAFGKDAFEAKAEAVNSAVEAREQEAKAKADAEAAREPSAPIGLRFFESIADKIPGPVGVFAQDAMSHFATNALHYYLTFVTLPIALIILFIAVKSMRPTDEQKSKKAQQAKDAKKKKDDDVKEDDDDENEGDENEPPAEDEKKTPSKRRVRRSS